MLKKMTISNLFGRFNYDIEFYDGGITIITGPNGFGKSTILNFISAINKGDLQFFFGVKYDKLVFSFEEEEELIITKNKKSIKFNDESISEEDIYKSKRYMRRDPLRRISETKYLNMLTDEIISRDEYIELRNELVRSKGDKVTNLQNKLMKILPNLNLIREQRLYRFEKSEYNESNRTIEIINDLPKKLLRLLEDLSTRYTMISNKLDGSYLSRFINITSGIDKEEFIIRKNILDKNFMKIVDYGLSENVHIERKMVFKQDYSRALKVYFDDFDTKFEVYDKFIQKMDMFKKIINERLRFKNLKVSAKFGFKVIDDQNEQEIPLSNLSSGEKHEIVLFYKLIFDDSANSLILIDEPELSLHVEWQVNFLNDLLKIAELENRNVIIATHSPQIINSHRDIQIDLGEMYRNGI